MRGKTVSLRMPVEEDLPAFARWAADMRVRRGCVWHEPAATATWKERLTEESKEPKSILWSIESEGRLVGFCRLSLEGENPSGTVPELTHLVIDPDGWRKGYGFDAALALHRFTLDYLSERTVTLAVPADGAAMLRIAEKLGHARYGVGHQVHYRDGAYVDQIHLRLDREDWERRWPGEREYSPLGPESSG